MVPLEEVQARAKRLGITIERVLLEYARIGFSDIRRIVEWGPGEDGLRIRFSGGLRTRDAVAVAEIVASAATGKIYRIKMHDKSPALSAIGRAIGVFLAMPTDPDQKQQASGDAESARERLILALDRLAAESAEGPGDPKPVG